MKNQVKLIETEMLPLLSASYRGDHLKVKTLIDQGADIDAMYTINGCRYNALMLAAAQGHIDVCKVLLEATKKRGRPLDYSRYINERSNNPNSYSDHYKDFDSFNICEQDHEGKTALILALESDHIEIFKLILNHPAYLKAYKYSGEQLRYLNNLNEKVSRLDYFSSVVGYSQLIDAFFCAAERKCDELLKIIISHQCFETSNYGYSSYGIIQPLKFAIMKKDILLCKMLLDNGAAVSRELVCDVILDFNSSEILEVLLNSNDIINDTCPSDRFYYYKSDVYTDKDGMSFLHLACLDGRVTTIDLLLQHRIDVNNKSWSGQTALMYAILYPSEQKDAVLNALFSSEDLSLDIRDRSGETALHIACQKGDVTAINLLLQHCIDVNIKSKSGQTALMCAILYPTSRQDSVLKALLSSSDLDLEICDDSGQTALDYAKKSGNSKIVECLIKKGAKHGVLYQSQRIASNHIAKISSVVALSSCAFLLSRCGFWQSNQMAIVPQGFSFPSNFCDPACAFFSNLADHIYPTLRYSA